MDFRVCFITVPTLEEGKKLARILLDARAAACVNILPGVTSLYWWEGAICEDTELLLMVKTSRDRVQELIELVRANHPYDVPEVLSVPVEDGNPPYLRWLEDSLQAGSGI